MTSTSGLTSEQTLALIFPPSVSHGYGGHLVGHDGKIYLDMISAWGTNLLGYGHPRIAKAIAAQAALYTNLGIAGPEYGRLLNLLVQYVPSAEAMHLVKNGSDACAVAVRLARHITKRDLVLHRGYHGVQDWYMASLGVPGVPASSRTDISALSTLTPEAVAQALNVHGGRVACLMIDPMVPPIPDATSMREIARLVRKAGALLVFDEVVSGFRVAAGGMQQVWDVMPDLTCLGKGMGNGMPIAALVGPKVYLNKVMEVNYSLTYGLEACSIVAACETIEVVVDEDVPAKLGHLGQKLKKGVERLANKYGLPAMMVGPDVRPTIYLAPSAGLAEGVGSFKVLQALVQRHVSTYGTFSFCAAHLESDVDLLLEAFETAFSLIVTEAIGEGAN